MQTWKTGTKTKIMMMNYAQLCQKVTIFYPEQARASSSSFFSGTGIQNKIRVGTSIMFIYRSFQRTSYFVFLRQFLSIKALSIERTLKLL